MNIPPYPGIFLSLIVPFAIMPGNRQLRRYAEASNVSVRGVLFIFDELVANNVIPSQLAATKLRELVAINVRLPKAEIEKRINNWSKSQ